jgi:hypothetical protein
MLDVFVFLYLSVSDAIYTAQHCIVINCVYVLCIATVYWMNVEACCMFLNFVSRVCNAMCIGLHCIVVDCIHILCIYFTLDELLAWMLICVMITCTLCFRLVPTMTGAFV